MSDSEPEMDGMALLRVVVLAVGCLASGTYLMVRQMWEAPLPAKEVLQAVSGTLQLETGVRTSRRSWTEYPVLVIGGQRYTYMEWFPDADTLPDRIRTGDTVSILADAENKWVWQIERNGEVIVPYAAVREKSSRIEPGAPSLAASSS